MLNEYSWIPNARKNHLPKNKKATIIIRAIANSRMSTVLRRSGATFFSAAINRGILPKPSITNASVMTEEINESIKTPCKLFNFPGKCF